VASLALDDCLDVQVPGRLRLALRTFVRAETGRPDVAETVSVCVTEAVNAARAFGGEPTPLRVVCGCSERFVVLHVQATGCLPPGVFIGSFAVLETAGALDLDADDPAGCFAATIGYVRRVASSVEVHARGRDLELRFAIPIDDAAAPRVSRPGGAALSPA
jgi:hypothetical protein